MRTHCFSGSFPGSCDQRVDGEVLKNLCAWRLITIKDNRPVLYTAKLCMGECTTPACILVFHFLSSALPKKQLCELKVMLKMNTKEYVGISHQQSQRPRSARSHMPTQCFAHRQTLGSGLGFIREMHSIAISGKHILPCTYPLIALLLHKGKIDGCIFDAVYFFN